MADVSCVTASFAPRLGSRQPARNHLENRGEVLWSNFLLTFPKSLLVQGPLSTQSLRSLFSKLSVNFKTVLAPNQHVPG